MEKKYSFKKTITHFLLFVLLVGGVMWILLRKQNIGEMVTVIRESTPIFLILGAMLAFCFCLGEAMNIKIILEHIGYTIPMIQALKYALIGFFFSSITPSATGGQPMQIYAMHRDKIEVSHSSLALLIELTSFQVVTFFLGVVALCITNGDRVQEITLVRVMAVIGLLLNGMVIAFLVLAIFSNGFSNWICKISERLIFKIPILKEEKKQSAILSLKRHIVEYQQCAGLLRESMLILGKVIFVTTIQTICWFSVPYMVYLSLGQRVSSYGEVLVLQILVHLAASVIPLPGAVGVSENSFMMLFGTIYTTKMLGSAMLLSRGLSFYFLVIISIVLLVGIFFFAKRKDKIMIEL